MEWSWLGFPLTLLCIGIGAGITSHGFKIVEIHKHYHNKDEE